MEEKELTHTHFALAPAFLDNIDFRWNIQCNVHITLESKGRKARSSVSSRQKYKRIIIQCIVK